MKRADYKFMRTRDGVTRFANVTILATPNDGWELSLEALSDPIQKAYEADARAGLHIAMDAHERCGGVPCKLTVENLIHIWVDASSDAVTCASAIAAWLSLGHEEHDAQLAYEGGRWTVSIGPRG